ncbi:Protein TRANSPARENT TESTA 12 [Morella rubra]|uniref:Protein DETOXIFICATION n=1 Tax=Morella rubra TaxID=262757 RepID=A0A6A1W4E9_9ROSI|nr:Protein TRANSPARENT TESTA 12 [Morella rubra]
MDTTTNEGDEDLSHPLVSESSTYDGAKDREIKDLASRFWIESKKLWHIVGPAIFSRVVSFSMNVITQAFAGHLGDIELAAMSIAGSVILGFSFGLLLGMASALETLCGQAFGAKRYHMFGIYLQRSWFVLLLCAILLLPIYIFAAPILKLLGLSDEVSDESGLVALWIIPMHIGFAFLFPVQRFLQSQLKTFVIAWVSFVGLLVNVLLSWLFVYVWDFGLVGAVAALDISWWVLIVFLYGYATCGGCPQTWTGFSVQAFSGLWEFTKLSAASGVMLCLENWYYRILTLMTGYLKDATIAIDALSVCLNITGWEMMIPLAFFAGGTACTTKLLVVFCIEIDRVRVANELGAGCIHFHVQSDVLEAVDKMTYLLGITILLNSVQPVLSGVAVGSGRQAFIAYINLGCYYVIGLPLGIVMGWVFDLGVMPYLSKTNGQDQSEGYLEWHDLRWIAVQTVILAVITIRVEWENQAENASKRMSK